MAMGSVEWQHPVTFRGDAASFEHVIFVDAGAATDHLHDAVVFPGVGTGVRWSSPVGTAASRCGLRHEGAEVAPAPARGVPVLMVEAASNPPVRRRWARAWLWLAAVLSVLLLLVAGIIWWAGSEGSLPRALHLAQTFLPDDQQLVVTDAKGSITGGGRIARLQWSKPGTTVTIENLRLGLVAAPAVRARPAGARAFHRQYPCAQNGATGRTR